MTNSPPDAAAPTGKGTAHALGAPVRVVDVDMPFASMVGFMVKWALASIPALLILVFLGMAVYAALLAMGILG